MSRMTRKVIIDCDPGIDDAVAICLALFDPRLEVVAITATEGNVSADQSTRNVQALVEQFDPPRYPRIGTASPLESAPTLNTRQFHGDDGLGNAGLQCSRLHHQHPSDKLICDEVRAAPEQVTILCFGPLTNLARAFRRDPAIIPLVGRVVIMGGSILAGGNITPAAEFNMFFDPLAARQVLRSAVTKTLLPLDLIQQMGLNLSFLDELPDEQSRAGKVLRRILPFMYRAYHQQLGQESIVLHDILAYLAVVQPELFQHAEMSVDIETRGELTTGATVFDRRPRAPNRPNTEVGIEIDAAAAMDCLIRGLQHAGQCTF